MASEELPHPWRVFWATVKQFDAGKMSPSMGLRNAAGVALPIAAGIAFGKPIIGALMCTGALNVAFSDGHDPYGHRARRMLSSSVLGAFAVFLGAFSGNSAVWSVLLSALWAFTTGMMVAVGTAATDLATISLVAFLVFHARPMAPGDAALAGLAALAGGLLQTGIALALWPMRRYEPERRSLSKLYHELASITAGPVDGFDSPRASSQISDARLLLETLARQHTTEGDRCVSLLNQAERIRLSLLTLGRLRGRLLREERGKPGVEAVDLVLRLSSQVLETIANVLTSNATTNDADKWCGELRHLSDPLRNRQKQHHQEEEPAFLSAVFASAQFQIDALEGQLRAAVDLAASTTPKGQETTAEKENAKPSRLQLRGSFATLRANFHLDSAAFRHAIRLAACVSVGEALGRGINWQRTYWLPMTVAIVLKPDFTATFSRGVLRLGGTFAGLFFATMLFHVLPAGVGAEIVLVTALTFVLRWAGPANYGILVTAVSALVVVLVAITGVAPKDVILARGLNTMAGGLLALMAYIVWPTWERTQIRATTAAMLDAYRDYFRLVAIVFQQPSVPGGSRLDAARMTARLKRSNVEASIDRLSAEPGIQANAVIAWSAMLASSHGVINAVMALDAALPGESDGPAPDTFRTFSHDVEIALHSIASALRGSTILARALPDLREDHRRLAECLTEISSQGNGRDALIVMETDRLTNRVNTLGEQVVTWITAHPTPLTIGPL